MYHQPELNFTENEVIVYLRKSRSDDPTLTVEEVLEKHESILDEWAEKQFGVKVPAANKYREVVSGETLKERPEINIVLRLVESPKYKAVAVVEPQRLTRGDLEDIGRLMKLLKHTNTLVITPQRIYDLRDEYDWDAFERELKRGNDYLEYTKKILNRGKLLSVSQGNYIGSFAPFGYDKTVIEEGKKKCPTLKPNQDADTVRMIFDLYVNKDWGYRHICNHLDNLGIKPPKGEKWSDTGMPDILSNVHYTGKVKWNWRKTVTIVEDSEIIKTRPKSRIGEFLVYEGKHEAIIPEELFNAAQEKRGKNPRVPSKAKLVNPLAGILFCECGRAMSQKVYNHTKQSTRYVCEDQRHCKNGSCTYDDIITRVCNVLEQCIEDFEIRLKNDTGDSVKLHASLIKNLETKLKKLEAKELSQWEAQADPDPANRMPAAIFQQLNAKLLKEKQEIQDALCKARETMPEPVDYEEKLCRFRDALEALKNPDAPPEEKNKLLKTCIERIDYSREAPYRLKAVNGKCKSGLKRGSNWAQPPINIDVKLRV